MRQWKKNVQDVEGEILCGMSLLPELRQENQTHSDESLVSQFTLFGQLKKGNKPDFHEAADAATARRVYDYFYQRLRESYRPERVKNGVFQAMMDVELKNDGPVCVLSSCTLTSLLRIYRHILTLRIEPP